MYADEFWFREKFDSVVRASGLDGLPLKESREQVALLYEDAIRSGSIVRPEIDLFTEGKALFNSIVEPERDKRTTRLQKTAQHLVEALNDDTVLGRDDPALHLAYKLGDRDGTDKILTAWTPDDWQNAIMVRYRGAAEATEKAKEFDTVATEIVAVMYRRGAHTTADLFADTNCALAEI